MQSLAWCARTFWMADIAMNMLTGWLRAGCGDHVGDNWATPAVGCSDNERESEICGVSTRRRLREEARSLLLRLSFDAGYYEMGILVNDLRRIFCRYMRTWPLGSFVTYRRRESKGVFVLIHSSTKSRPSPFGRK